MNGQRLQQGVGTRFEQMKSNLKTGTNSILISFFLIGWLTTLLCGSAVAATGEYEVHLSWFIDMAQYDVSAHNELYCLQCHQPVAKQVLHPDPANVTRDAGQFFSKDHCAGSDCHENTLKDYQKGLHGRIQFKNREKYSNCIECHDPHSLKSTKLSSDPAAEKKGRALCQPENAKQTETVLECKTDAECLECHIQTTSSGSEAASKEASLCFGCHDQTGPYPKKPEFSRLPTFDVAAYHKTEHAESRCTECHTRSASYGHVGVTRECKQCHHLHNEREIHDAHSTVSCKACHLEGVVEADPDKGLITWQPEWPRRNPVAVHQLIDTEDEVNCVRCHTEENKLGAAAMVLPAKSIICMSCHTATFAVSDPITLITLLVGFIIFSGLLSLWLSAGPTPEDDQGIFRQLHTVTRATLAVVFSRRIFSILKAVLLEAIIQRRLFAQSKWRWFSHGLIFYPFLLRFSWGLISLLLSLILHEWEPVFKLLDKNQPLVAFLFDLTGVLIIAGVMLTVFRKVITKKSRWPGLPKQEWLSVALIGGIIIVGFVLEGLRIAMTVDSAGKQFAFLGYTISLLFNNINGSTEVFGYVWYLHAILTSAFIIWLPFSRMFHIVMGPVAVAVNAAQSHN
ncbi:MAG: hypothetical protein HOD85_01370 [Deltaproteobacteria bacterium]|jgi:predicted CXXCH cytochrome family protein|nr:hypothetical protein [Deltaproteobacteria bacterium]